VKPIIVAALALVVGAAATGCSADQSVRATSAVPIGAEPVSESTTTTSSPTEPTTLPSETTVPVTLPIADAIEWSTCDDPSVTDDALECATIAVPLDYAAPDGGTIDIALVRVPATDDRVGAILFNPGGPGGSGFDYIAQGGSVLTSEMSLQGFDLIGFDPRGVDRSNGIRCLDDARVDATIYLDSSPDTPEEQAALDAAADEFDAACIAKYGDTMRLYSTENTARDMEMIRAGLGDEQLSYLGVSYGTYLGAVYATLFPERVRALVLDAAFEPTGDSVDEQYLTQLVGFEEAFDSWATWCETAASCAFASTDVGAAWDALRVELDRAPIPNTDGRLGNQAVMETATISALYSETEWPLLAQALDDASVGDPEKLFVLADQYVGRNDDGTYSTIEQSGTIIRCASGIDYEQPADPQALVDQLLAAAPRFAQGVRVEDFEDSCAALMDDVTAPALSYTGDAPVLVVGGLNDPATPIRWAEEMTAAMGANARMVTYSGEGHGFVLSSTCVTELEAATLVDLTTPDEDMACDPDPDVAKPEWWDSLPTPDGISEPIDGSAVNAALGLTPDLAYSAVRSSDLSPAEVLDAYDAVIGAQGFESAGREEPIPGVPQAIYFSPDGQVFSVLVIGPEAMAGPDLEGLDKLVDPTKTLVVLLAFPPF
jgi:pimeloyl-ACP methyl ester carboxylesterase